MMMSRKFILVVLIVTSLGASSAFRPAKFDFLQKTSFDINTQHRAPLSAVGRLSATVLSETNERQRVQERATKTFKNNGYIKKTQPSPSRTSTEHELLSMIKQYSEGDREVKITRRAFHSALKEISSNSQDAPYRCESLLLTMDDFVKEFPEMRSRCQPTVSEFNIMLNCWAKSKLYGSASRVNAILDHMNIRYASGATEVRPDVVTYTTAIKAWSKSKEYKNPTRIQTLLDEMEATEGIEPNFMTFNSILDYYAKNKGHGSSESALSILQRMRDLSEKRGHKQCAPDIVTFTSVIDVLAEDMTVASADKAVELLDEVESMYEETKDPKMKPNIHLYTSVISAVGKAGADGSDRADAIFDRLRRNKYGLTPDIYPYNALMTSYCWSKSPGGAKKCYDIFMELLDNYKADPDNAVRPDIISCNMVISACAHENVETDEEHKEIMDMAIKTMEVVESSQPKIAMPNMMTFTRMLTAIINHMPDGDQKINMVEAIFWQCCKYGFLGKLIVPRLKSSLPWERFTALMGPALISKEDEQLTYDLNRLPADWTRFGGFNGGNGYQSKESKGLNDSGDSWKSQNKFRRRK